MDLIGDGVKNVILVYLHKDIEECADCDQIHFSLWFPVFDISWPLMVFWYNKIMEARTPQVCKDVTAQFLPEQ